MTKDQYRGRHQDSIVLRIALAPWAVLAVLAVLPLANAQMGQPEYNTDRPGQDLHHFKASGWQECATSCRSQDACRAYTFVNSTQTCWLKGAVPVGRKATGMTSGVRIMGPMERSVDRPGRDLRPGFLSASPAACERSCQTDSACAAWTWVKPGRSGQGACWLKSSAPAPRKNDCCLSGIRLAGNPVRSAVTVERMKTTGKRSRVGATAEVPDHQGAPAPSSPGDDPLGGVAGQPRSENEYFTDVPGDASYAGLLDDAVQLGIVDAPLPCDDGFAGSCFRPDDDINRAEWSRMIVEAYGLALSHPTSPPFTDVPLGEWYTESIATIVEHGIARGYLDVSGDPTGLFGPADPLTREQAMKMVVLAVPLTTSTSCGPTYADVPPSRWSYQHVETGYANSIVELGSGMFHPDNYLSRAEAIGFAVNGLEPAKRPCASQGN